MLDVMLDVKFNIELNARSNDALDVMLTKESPKYVLRLFYYYDKHNWACSIGLGITIVTFFNTHSQFLILMNRGCESPFLMNIFDDVKMHFIPAT